MTVIGPNGEVTLDPSYLNRVVTSMGRTFLLGLRGLHARITAWRPDKTILTVPSQGGDSKPTNSLDLYKWEQINSTPSFIYDLYVFLPKWYNYIKRYKNEFRTKC